LERDLKISSW